MKRLLIAYIKTIWIYFRLESDYDMILSCLCKHDINQKKNL